MENIAGEQYFSIQIFVIFLIIQTPTLHAKKFRHKNFGRLIFRQFFLISAKFQKKITDTKLKHYQSKFLPTKHELDWQNVSKL